MSGKFDLGDYNEVKDRIAEFRAKHPEGSLQSEVCQTGIDGFITVKAYAFRSPDDERPGVGLAWEPVPGRTPYTKDSELQNAETSAWGRAIIAVGAADASKGIASREEVQNRREAPQRTDIAQDPADWLAIQVRMFAEWDDEKRREAYKTAVKMLAVDTPLSKPDAEAVFEHMSGAYHESHPSDPERPF